MTPVLRPGQCAVMAVVNRTPDSFYDRGATFALEAAVSAAVAAADAGADWIDIGGMPFSPDTPMVSASEEIDRVVPVIAGLLERRCVVVSVDTWRPAVAQAALAVGARVINDVSGLQDPAMAELAAASGAGLIVTHSIAKPHQHHHSPQYADVVSEVVGFLRDRVEAALAVGVSPEQIVVDPGHDLNKNTLHSLELTRRLDEVVQLGYPTLAAVSRKDFLAEALDLPKSDLHDASVVAAAWALARGARIIRMHDVASGVTAVRLAEIINGNRAPLGKLRHNV